MKAQRQNQQQNGLCRFKLRYFFYITNILSHHPQLIPLLMFSFSSSGSNTHSVLKVAPGLPGVYVCADTLLNEQRAHLPFLQL